MSFYSANRIIKLLNTSIDFITDVIYPLKVILSNSEFKPMKKPRSIYQLHENVTELSEKIEIGNLALNQREDVLKLEGEVICEDLTVSVPTCHFDLVSLGEKLSFCIGNGHYTDEVINDKCSIVSILNKKKKPVYGVQFTRYAISSAYGFGNEPIPNDIKIELERLLLAKPSLPDDFIAFSHSFMAGYKYNNKDLYILFSANDAVYIYEDVPHDTYDEFMHAESKGSYFAKHIRNKYRSAKIN